MSSISEEHLDIRDGYIWAYYALGFTLGAIAGHKTGTGAIGTANVTAASAGSYRYILEYGKRTEKGEKIAEEFDEVKSRAREEFSGLF
ncbi:MAG: hypothetical protein ABEJ56_00500 [Candidatus Nanohaloarchaea archaeon]